MRAGADETESGRVWQYSPGSLATVVSPQP